MTRNPTPLKISRIFVSRVSLNRNCSHLIIDCFMENKTWQESYVLFINHIFIKWKILGLDNPNWDKIWEYPIQWRGHLFLTAQNFNKWASSSIPSTQNLYNSKTFVDPTLVLLVYVNACIFLGTICILNDVNAFTSAMAMFW